MPSSKRVTGNFNFWTGASENWQYFDSTSNSLVTVRRGNKDTVFQSANLVVYGNIVGLGGNIYANITGNIVLGNGINYGILYKAPGGNAAVSNEFTIDEANNAVAMTGNITVSGAGKGNVIANNISSNRVTATFANITSANIGTANIATNGNITAGNIRAVSYLNLTGGNVLYGNANVAVYLPTYTGNLVSLTGNVTTTANVQGAYILGNGAFITGLSSSYSNANVANYLPTYSGNLSSLTGNVTTTANVSANYLLGNITQATGYSTYGNANVDAYLPTYTGNLSPGNVTVSGNLETANANISGLGIFSSVSNLRIPGGNVGQAMISNGAGGVSFQDVSATPGNAPGSFQYNSNGTALYGLDDFIYNDSGIGNIQPRLQLTNLNFTIDKANSNANVQLTVIGNLAVNESPFDANTGYILIGGIDRLAPEDLTGNTYDGQFVIVDGETLNYANGYSNADVANYLLTYTGNISAGNITTTSNVRAANFIVENSIVATSASPAATLSGFRSISTSGTANGNITASGNIVAAANVFGLSGIFTSNISGGNIAVTDRITFGDGTYQNTAWTGVANNYIALGTGAGGATQSQTAVAIGVNAGNVAQDYYTVAIGIGAGQNTQLAGAIAIGAEAGGNSQGTNSIAIGFRAGRANQANNSIVLNGTGANLNNTTANSFVVAPIRNTSGNAGILQYNNSTKEVTYSTTVNGNIQVNQLGVGTAPSGTNGEIVATGNIIAYFSDDRLKTRLGNIENALDKVDQLTTFYFEPNDIAVNTYGYTRHRDLGVSAQEVANVVPEIIADAPIGDGYLTVKYERFAPLIIAAIKELRQEINDIKRKL
jgi:hypothetical protein